MQPGPLRHTILHGEEIPALPEDVKAVFRMVEQEGAGTAIAAVREPLVAAIPELLPSAPQSVLDKEAFWGRAAACADVAAALARKTGESPQVAWIAAYLADMGKWALDGLTPEGYRLTLDATGAEGIYLLDAEREAFGADHTLAGKWLCERWRLPQPVVAAVWLHHHPAGVLDGGFYPVPLIDLVALALSVVSHGPEQLDRLPTAVQERRRRLGLSNGDLARALAGDAGSASEAPKPTQARDTADAGTSQSFLAAYRHYREVLDGQDEINSIMLAAAEGLREAFAVPAGICYARVQGRLFGQIWRSLETPMQPLTVNERLVQGSMGTPLAILLDAFEDLPAEAGHDDGIREHHGLTGVPIVHHGQVYGYFIVDQTQWEDAAEADRLAEVMAFTRAAGASLWQRIEHEAARAECEGLAEALWRQELRLKQERRQARQADLSHFAAGMAQPILACLDEIEGACEGDGLSMDRERARNRIYEARSLIEDALEVTAPDRGAEAPVALGVLLRRVNAAMERDLKARGIAVYEEYARNLPEVSGNEAKLAAAFRRLLQDCADAMGAEGGLITVKAWASPGGGSLMVQVSDTGPPVAESGLPDLLGTFAPSRSGGNAMRLALCKAVVEAHQGAMAVHNDPAHGVRFTITFPALASPVEDVPTRDEAAADDAPMPDGSLLRALEAVQIEPWTPEPFETPAPEPMTEAPALRPNPSPQSSAPGRILLVEGNDDLREVLRASLEGRGYQVEAYGDLGESLENIKALRPDAVLVDLGLADAWEGSPVPALCEHARGAAVIGIAGIGRDDAVEEALSAGAHACVQKPIEIEVLMEHLEQVVSDRRVA